MASAQPLVLTLLALLAGCQVQAQGPQADVQASLKAGDTRLIVRAGRGQTAPGAPAGEQADAKARCGIRYLEGLGDVIRPGEQEQHTKRVLYASEYNRLMLPHCKATQ